MRTIVAIALAVIMVLPLTLPAFAQTTTVIPRYTVIPVTLQQGLSSATNQVGDTFQVTCSGNCGGFPAGTRFSGRVISVTRADSSTPGQIEVRFYQASLPDGRTLPIDGTLTSLTKNDVSVDPDTGRLVQNPEVRNQRNKFIAYGAGLGLLIGVLTDNTLTGALLGALAGYLYGRSLGEETRYTDVNVAAGTEFGIALQRDVSFTTGAGPGAGPGTVPPSYTITFGQQRPFVTNNNVVMVPFRTVMNQVDQSFAYSPSQRMVTLYTRDGQLIQHTAGTRVIYVDGGPLVLSAPSRNIGGTLYVPSDMIRVITGGTVTWQPNTGTLVIS